MANYICVICGNQFGESAGPPPRCPICEDERQWVNYEGQSWTTLDEMAGKYRNVMRPLEPGLTEFSTAPKFGIGQRTLLVQADKGNVLWDCVSHIDQETVDAVGRARRAGGRVVAVGTTSARALEAAWGRGGPRAFAGETTLYITPGHRFRAIDGLLTNFHLPRSTLLVMTCAFAGRENVLGAYREAVAREYRFLSFGDAMLVV